MLRNSLLRLGGRAHTARTVASRWSQMGVPSAQIRMFSAAKAAAARALPEVDDKIETEYLINAVRMKL